MRGQGSDLDHVAAPTVTHLLPAVTNAVTAHRTGQCPWCTPATRRDCPVLGLAVVALDLIIGCWRTTYTTPQTSGRGAR